MAKYKSNDRATTDLCNQMSKHSTSIGHIRRERAKGELHCQNQFIKNSLIIYMKLKYLAQ
jgi:hypothetical protein